MLANKRAGTFYVGVTSDLGRRMAEHTQGLIEGFTKRYGVGRLVYFEMHQNMESAIRREKRLKKWNRTWKIRLIEPFNPEWIDSSMPGTGRSPNLLPSVSDWKRTRLTPLTWIRSRGGLAVSDSRARAIRSGGEG